MCLPTGCVGVSHFPTEFRSTAGTGIHLADVILMESIGLLSDHKEIL